MKSVNFPKEVIAKILKESQSVRAMTLTSKAVRAILTDEDVLEGKVSHIERKRGNHVNSHMGFAVRIGDKKLVDHFISKGACDWELGLALAGLYGHLPLAEFFSAKQCAAEEAEDYFEKWEYSGLSIVEFFADECNKGGRPDPNNFLTTYLDTLEDADDETILADIKSLGKLGADLSRASYLVNVANDSVLMDMFVQFGADCDEALVGCVLFGALNTDTVSYLIANGATRLDDALEISARMWDQDAVMCLISKGATDLQRALSAVRSQDPKTQNPRQLRRSVFVEMDDETIEMEHAAMLKFLTERIGNIPVSETSG